MKPKFLVGCVLVLAALPFSSGCKSSSDSAESTATTAAGAEASAQNGRVAITVDGEGYHPAKIRAKRGEPLTMVFTRTTDQSCGQELVFPSENLRRELPLNEAVAVQITPRSDTVRFTCGMNMYEGVVQTE